MFGLQFDQVGVAIVTALIMLVLTWCVTNYLGHEITLTKKTQNNMKKLKKDAKTQTSAVNTSSAQTETKKTQKKNTKKLRKDVETQMSLPVVNTSSVQTETRFSERLTNFSEKEVGLGEKFDKFCETCEASIRNEAVGFCKMCEKFMCLNCCKHHEKIPLSKNHVLFGKEQFKGVRNQKKMFDKSFIILQNFHLHVYDEKWCTRYCYADQCIQPLCLTKDEATKWDAIRCLGKQNKKKQVVFQWKEKKQETFHKMSLLEKDLTPADICTFRSPSNIFGGWYFTIPNEKKICKYSNKDDIEFIYIYGKCFGIAVFNEGLAISIYIPTNYSLPEWQVQYISFSGTVNRQICYDNEGEPLFKEPRHLTSNDAEDILFVSDQGNHCVIALDTKGYVLFKYTHETINRPCGLTCDDEGNIYVASGNKVVQIDQHGVKSRVVLSAKEGKDRNNVSLIDVCYNKFTNELGVLSQSGEVTILKPLP